MNSFIYRMKPIVVIMYMCIHNTTGSHSSLLLLFRVNIFANEFDESLCYVPGSTDPGSDKNPCNLGIKIRRSRKAIQAIIKVWIQEEKPSQAQASCLITRLIQNSLLT